MPLTPDAIQNVTDGQDFYVLVLNEDASNLEYASYFGEVHHTDCGYSGHDHVDGGTSRFDKKGHIIQSVCASCGGCQQFPTSPSPGAWSNTNNATNCNNAVFKIRIIENLAEANFDPIPIACAPITVDFNNTSQGTTFVWDFGDGSSESTDYNPSHTYTEGGEYTVILVVGDPLSCNFYDTIVRVITVVEPGQTNLPDLEICPGENVIVGPTGAYPNGTSFLWVAGSNLSSNNIQNPIASPDETDDYLMIATGVCIDSSWQHIVVYEPEFDLLISSDTLICLGGEAGLFASTSGGVDSWQWSSDPGFNTILSTSQSLLVSPTSNTTYYVRAQENLCNTYLTEQVLVILHGFNYWLDNEHILCPGNSINLALNNQSVTDVLTYSWEPTAQIISGETTSNPLVGPLTNTTYFVTITNQMGCTTTDEVDVTIDNIIFNTPTLVHNLCFGYCLGTASVSATGIPPYTYEWNTSDTESTITELCADSFTVTVTDDHGCTTETEITIIEPPVLSANFINVVDPACDGIGYGSATISPVGGTPPYTYSWAFGGSQATNNNCLVGDNVVNVTDANGCTTEQTINMPAPGSLISSLDDYTMIDCYGNCNGTINVSANLGTPPYQYNWSSTLTGSNLTNLCPGAYTCTIVDDENCVSHQYIYIFQPDSLITNAQINDEISCFDELGDIGLLTTGGTQPYSYTWSTGSTDNQLNDVVAGQYLVTVIDLNNCEDHSVVSLIEPPEIFIGSTVINQLCNNVCNGFISVEVTGGVPPYYYEWSNGSLQSHADELCSGDYSLTMHDSNNCTHIREFTIINEGYVPDLDVTASSEEVFAGEQVALLAQSSQIGSYSWNNTEFLNHDDIPDPVATLFDSTLMRVVFRDENNCIAVDTVYIRVKEVICGDPYIYVPNAFTPDADGNNDYFKPYYPLSLVTEVYFAVFDRWGNIIYETTDLDANGWDGTYKGEVLTTDVYVFWLRARCLNGEEYNHKGNVTLLK